MFPSNALDNTDDRSLGHAILVSEPLIGYAAAGIAPANIAHIGFSELCAMLILSSTHLFRMCARPVLIAMWQALWIAACGHFVAACGALWFRVSAMAQSRRRSALAHHICHVVLGRAKKQMIEANTHVIITGMADKQASRNSSIRKLIGIAMRSDRMPINPKAPISSSGARRLFPDPAGFSYIDFRPEARIIASDSAGAECSGAALWRAVASSARSKESQPGYAGQKLLTTMITCAGLRRGIITVHAVAPIQLSSAMPPASAIARRLSVLFSLYHRQAFSAMECGV
jgi:hypothetical protein